MNKLVKYILAVVVLGTIFVYLSETLMWYCGYHLVGWGDYIYSLGIYMVFSSYFHNRIFRQGAVR